MKIYIAASMDAIKRCQANATKIHNLGHGVTSRWIHEPPELAPQKCARIDVEDIHRSELVIFDNQMESTTGGMHFEIGYATALDMPVWLIGKRTCIFHHMPNFKQFNSWRNVLATLAERKY